VIIHNRALGFAPYAVAPCLCRGRGICVECQRAKSDRNLKALGALVAGDVRGFGNVTQYSLESARTFERPVITSPLFFPTSLNDTLAKALAVQLAPVNVGRADGVILQGQKILPNQFVQSPNGKYQFLYSLNREIVVVGPGENDPINGGILKREATGFGPNSYLVLRGDKLCVEEPLANGSLKAQCRGREAIVVEDYESYGRMQDDGNFVVYSPTGRVMYETGTWFGAKGCPIGEKPEDVGTLRWAFRNEWKKELPGFDPKVAWDFWCDCKFMPGNWKDTAGVDALTRCKKVLSVLNTPGFEAPWTEWGGGQRGLPTGGGLLQAFAAMVREPTEEELELDYLCSLFFTDFSRWCGIMAYCGLRVGGPTFLGPVGLIGTAIEGLWSLISAPFDEGKKLRYFQKMGDAWYNNGLIIFLAGLTSATIFALAMWGVGAVIFPAAAGSGALVTAGAAAGTVVIGGTVVSSAVAVSVILTGALAVLAVPIAIGIEKCILIAAERIEERHGSFIAPWSARGSGRELVYSDEYKANWKPSVPALQRAQKYYFPSRIAFEVWAKQRFAIWRLLDPVTSALEDACELAAAFIPQTVPENKDIAQAKVFIRSIGKVASPIVKAALDKKQEAISSETTWETVSKFFSDAAAASTDAETKQRLTDWADFFRIFKSSIGRATLFAFEPTPEGFKKYIFDAPDSAFDRLPVGFVGQNMSSLSRSLDAVMGKPVNGRVLTYEERLVYADVFQKLNGDNFARLLRLIARILTFFEECLVEIKKHAWDILDGVIQFLADILGNIAEALMKARDFILWLIQQFNNVPDVPKTIEEAPPKKTVTVVKSGDDGLLAALLLGAGGGFVVGGPPGALVGAGAAAVLTTK